MSDVLRRARARHTFLWEPRNWLYLAFGAAVMLRLDWQPEAPAGISLPAALLVPITALAVARLTRRERLHDSVVLALLALALVRVAAGGSLSAAALHDPLFWGLGAVIALGASGVAGRWPVAAMTAAALGGACTLVAVSLNPAASSRLGLEALSQPLGVPATVLLLGIWGQALAGSRRRDRITRADAIVRGALLAGLVLLLTGAVSAIRVETGSLVALGTLLGLAESRARPPIAGFNWAAMLRPVNPASWSPIAILVLLEILFALLLLPAPGTGDVSSFFLGWISSALENGPVEAYRLAESNYPPLVVLVLWAAGQLGGVFSLGVFLSFKMLLAAALVAGTLCFWRWTSNVALTGLLALSLLVNGVALGYLDTLFAPALVLSLWALQQRRIALFSLLFAVSCLIKWQPLVILPYLLAHAHSWRVKRWVAIAGPAAAVILVSVAIFGLEPIWAAFTQGTNRNYLSGTAHNLNWILTYYLQVSDPGQHGALADGMTRIVEVDEIDPRLTWVRLVVPVFFVFYLAPLWRLFRNRGSFATTVECSLAAYLSYFMLNIGVHENHLFIGTVLAVTAAALDPGKGARAVLIVAMSTLNLITSYGLTGETLGFPTVVGIDVSIVFSALNVLLFLVFWTDVMWPLSKAGETQVSELTRRPPSRVDEH